MTLGSPTGSTCCSTTAPVSSPATVSVSPLGGLSSLQSLASTCLRAGKINASTPKYVAFNHKLQSTPHLAHNLGRFSSLSPSSCSSALPSPYPGQNLSNVSSPSSTLASEIAFTSSRKPHHWSDDTTVLNAVSAKPVTAAFTKKASAVAVASVQSKCTTGVGKSAAVGAASTVCGGGGGGCGTNGRTRQSSNHPQQGPHCEQFLRKMGLMSPSAASDLDEHCCDISFVNLTVSDSENNPNCLE